VVKAFKNTSDCSLKIKEHWENALRLWYQMKFVVSHIFREDKVAPLSKRCMVFHLEITLDGLLHQNLL